MAYLLLYHIRVQLLGPYLQMRRSAIHGDDKDEPRQMIWFKTIQLRDQIKEKARLFTSPIATEKFLFSCAGNICHRHKPPCLERTTQPNHSRGQVTITGLRTHCIKVKSFPQTSGRC